MFNKEKLDAAIMLSGKSQHSIATAIGMHEATFWRKVRDDGRFTRAEIDRMIDILKLEDPCDIFFAR